MPGFRTANMLAVTFNGRPFAQSGLPLRSDLLELLSLQRSVSRRPLKAERWFTKRAAVTGRLRSDRILG